MYVNISDFSLALKNMLSTQTCALVSKQKRNENLRTHCFLTSIMKKKSIKPTYMYIVTVFIFMNPKSISVGFVSDLKPFMKRFRSLALMFIYTYNRAKTAHHSVIFLRAIYSKMLSENKIISIPVCKWLISLRGSPFNNSNSQYNGNHYKMPLKILHLFLDRTTDILSYRYYNGNPRDSQVVLFSIKIYVPTIKKDEYSGILKKVIV